MKYAATIANLTRRVLNMSLAADNAGDEFLLTALVRAIESDAPAQIVITIEGESQTYNVGDTNL